MQRTLSAKNLVHAKGGVLLAAALKFLPLYLLVLPGMAARVLYTDSVACSDPEACRSICGAATGCSNLAYIELVLNLLPVGTSDGRAEDGAGCLSTFLSYRRQCTYGGKSRR